MSSKNQINTSASDPNPPSTKPTIHPIQTETPKPKTTQMPSTKTCTLELSQLSQNGSYYLKGADLHLLAGHTLFRVHSYFFERESIAFRERSPTTATPATGHAGQQGDSDSTAIVLENTTAEELTRFLGVFYRPNYTYRGVKVEEWTDIMKVAHQWGFPKVKELALRKLNKATEIELVDRIALYTKYEAPPEYMYPLYSDLAERPQSLTWKETKILGEETVYVIFRAREELRSPLKSPLSPLPPSIGKDDIKRAIEGIERARVTEATGSTKGPAPTTNGHKTEDAKKPNGTGGDAPKGQNKKK